MNCRLFNCCNRPPYVYGEGFNKVSGTCAFPYSANTGFITPYLLLLIAAGGPPLHVLFRSIFTSIISVTVVIPARSCTPTEDRLFQKLHRKFRADLWISRRTLVYPRLILRRVFRPQNSYAWDLTPPADPHLNMARCQLRRPPDPHNDDPTPILISVPWLTIFYYPMTHSPTTYSCLPKQDLDKW